MNQNTLQRKQLRNIITENTPKQLDQMHEQEFDKDYLQIVERFHEFEKFKQAEKRFQEGAATKFAEPEIDQANISSAQEKVLNDSEPPKARSSIKKKNKSSKRSKNKENKSPVVNEPKIAPSPSFGEASNCAKLENSAKIES